MNFAELKAIFENNTGVSGETGDTELALWFNEAQLDLAYDFGAIDSEVISAEDNDYAPGQDWLAIISCDIPYARLPDGKLRFSGGSGRIYYRKMPPAFDGLDQEQESALPNAVHHLIAIFATSRRWDVESDGDGEESGHATKWLSYYYQGKNMAKNRMNINSGDYVDRWNIVD